MILSALATLGAPLLKGLFGAIDKVVEDKDEAARIKATLQEMVLTGQMKEIEEAASIIRAEASGDSWLQRSWRPMVMLAFVGLIITRWMGYATPGMSEAEYLSVYELIKLGLGGYVVGRSVEKGIKVWKDKS